MPLDNSFVGKTAHLVGVLCCVYDQLRVLKTLDAGEIMSGSGGFAYGEDVKLAYMYENSRPLRHFNHGESGRSVNEGPFNVTQG